MTPTTNTETVLAMMKLATTSLGDGVCVCVCVCVCKRACTGCVEGNNPYILYSQSLGNSAFSSFLNFCFGLFFNSENDKAISTGTKAILACCY